MSRSMRNGWTVMHGVLAAALVALSMIPMHQAWEDIYRIARKDEESSHILLVPIVVAWLIWVRRGRFRLCQPRRTWIGPVILAMGWFLSIWGYANAVIAFWHAGAIMMAVGAALSVWGSDVLLRFFPAFAVLIFLVPIPGMIRQSIAIPLQTITAQVTEFLLEILGMNVQRSGNLLSVNGQPVTIAEACNGMRMVFTLVLVCYAFAFGEPLRNYVRAIILLASPVSAIVCNVIRMLPTMYMYGHASKSAADTFHDLSGWIMLALAFLLLLAIIRLLRWAMIPVVRYTLAAE